MNTWNPDRQFQPSDPDEGIFSLAEYAAALYDDDTSTDEILAGLAHGLHHGLFTEIKA
jgi:hypothetical protein